MKLSTVMRQAEGNEKDLKKLMSLFDEVMSRVAEFNSKADELGYSCSNITCSIIEHVP